MIIKRKHAGSYAVIPNSVSNDDRLKADTLGALVYLLAKPEDWKVSIADIGKRFGIGRDRVYVIMQELEAAGYVKRAQNRASRSQFSSIEYHVFDCPQSNVVEEEIPQNEPFLESPLTENQEAVKPQQNTISGLAVYGATVSGKSGRILSTDLTNTSSKGNSASVEAGADTPSVSKEVWNEGIELLKTTSPNPNRSIIGKWLKRTETKKDGKEKLLAMIRAAVKAGTLDPIAYVSKALDTEFGQLPQPKQFDAVTWHRNIQAAINTKDWSPAWGPPPGKKGCLIPPELITAQLTSALAGWKAAA
ncbi:MAG TPA: helix-turn-helix domain-containing protein [Aestuariivirga sp.]|nr:helix-turn-helix domain-containing protein [Aestuariivirga sp.]